MEDRDVEKKIELLHKGLFEKPFMDSRVKTRTVSMVEKIW